jgi:hypothetical protein
MKRAARALLVALGLAWAAPSPARADVVDDCANAAEAGQALITSKKLVEAREKLLSCARDACPAQMRADCTRWAGQLESAVPTVVVHAKDSRGRDVIGVRVLVDGAVVAERLDGAPRSIDPGAHRFRFEARAAAVEENVLIAEGERDRPLTASFAVALTPDGTLDVAKPEPSAGPARSSHADAYVLGAFGIAALGVFAYLDASAYSDYRGLRDGCGATQSCSGGDVGSVRTRFTLAAVMLGVGAVSLGVGAFLYFVVDPRPGGGAAEVGARF